MATTPQTNVTLAEFAEALDRFESFALCGHVSPDGDCLGSQLALAHALRAKGKRAVCLLAHDDAVDKSFLFLPGANELIPACEFESCDAAKTFRIQRVQADVHCRKSRFAVHLCLRCEQRPIGSHGDLPDSRQSMDLLHQPR